MSVIYPDQILLKAEQYFGWSYKLGAEATPTNNTRQLDCSEYVELVMATLEYDKCHPYGKKFPDLCQWQYEFCKNHGTLIPLEEARRTPASLIFLKAQKPRPDKQVGHVVFSDGRNNTLEARNTQMGVGKWPWRTYITTQFYGAARIPYISY